jgi:hypothetical protein
MKCQAGLLPGGVISFPSTKCEKPAPFRNFVDSRPARNFNRNWWESFSFASFGAILTVINLRVTTMMVRNLGRLAFAMVVVSGFATAARANEAGLSQQTLDQMGLSGMSVMTDEAGLAVRGMGFAKVYGHSWASVTTHNASAGSENGYAASGKNSASGKNNSYAGVIVKKSGGHGGHGDWGDKGGCHSCGGGGGGKSKSILAFSGGSSSARTKGGKH